MMTQVTGDQQQKVLSLAKSGVEKLSQAVRTAHGYPRRKRLTVSLPLPLLERLRNAIYWTRNRTLAQLIADGIEETLTEMEQANGGRFPTRLESLKAGRPPRKRALSRSMIPRLTLSPQDDVTGTGAEACHQGSVR